MTWKYLVAYVTLKVPFSDTDPLSKEMSQKQLQKAIDGLTAFIDKVDGPQIIDTDQLRGTATPPSPQDNPFCPTCE